MIIHRLQYNASVPSSFVDSLTTRRRIPRTNRRNKTTRPSRNLGIFNGTQMRHDSRESALSKLYRQPQNLPSMLRHSIQRTEKRIWNSGPTLLSSQKLSQLSNRLYLLQQMYNNNQTRTRM
ncbi:unnamed protein product [Lasius platythorax]|uniref:Uncharacterized protein n=1 Tax=Lasius platythorax TaxID=488582 RepID=A0AAV2NE67_9HYME